MNYSNSNKGNILFLILIAVALFAALSYAITGSSRSGSNTISKDKAKLAASHILSWTAKFDKAVQRMMIIDGVKPYELSFRSNQKRYNGTFANNTYNNVRCSGTKCRVFHPDGGGMEIPDFSAYARQDYANMGLSLTHLAGGHMEVWHGNWRDSDLNDLSISFRFLKPEICAALYDMLKQKVSPMNGYSIVYYHSSYRWEDNNAAYGGDLNNLIATDSFVTNNASSHCDYYHLVASH
jgi:hypothetical protein